MVNFHDPKPVQATEVLLYIYRSGDFMNQLVATAVNAAGQAYVTTKAVFKTWQERKVGILYMATLNTYSDKMDE